MLAKVIVGLAVLAAIIEGVVPGMVPMALLPLALVILGLVYGVMCLDSDNRVGYCVVAAAVGLAGGADVLGNIHAIGGHLDSIHDHLATALYGGVAGVLAMSIWESLTAADGDG